MKTAMRNGCRWALAVAVACTGYLARSVAAADGLAYRLKVGEVLSYEGTGNSAYGDTKTESKTHVKVYVVSPAGAGWNLVVTQQQSMHEVGTPGENQTREYPESIARATLTPLGEITVEGNSVEGMIARQLVQGLFYPLPPAGGAKTWTAAGAFGSTITYQVVTPGQAGAGVWELSSDTESPENKIYLATSKGRAWVDADKGVPVKTETERTQDYGSKSTSSSTTEFKGLEDKDPAWMAQLDKETLIMSQATKDYQAAYGHAEDDPSHLDAIMGDAEKSLRAAVAQVTLESIHKPLQAMLDENAANIKSLKDEATRPGLKIGAAAPAWSGKDLGGHSLSLADLKGKVVVMDFWYRGCGWCMRAMPQINEAAASFKDQPVVVLGINIDEDTKDAQFVVDKLGLTYSTVVNAESIARAYSVRAYPTMVIIDQDGVVRNHDMGYSPDVKEKVSREIQSLLKK